MFVSPMQYPAIFVLAIVMSWYGMVQPYKKLSVNILEIALSSTVLVMFYIRNTDQINDDWQVRRPSITSWVCAAHAAGPSYNYFAICVYISVCFVCICSTSLPDHFSGLELRPWSP